VLYEIGKVLENKNLFEKANDIYRYIYENHKDNIKAGEALYRSAEIHEKLGKE